LEDPNLMSLRAVVAQQKAIVAELWANLGEGGSSGAIAAVQATWAALAPEERAAHPAHNQAVVALGSARDAAMKMEEVGRGLERQARLVKVATESNLEEIISQRFVLEVGYVQRA
jgi:hypothetical protein